MGELGYYTHTQDPEFALMQLGVRFYDAQVGRFGQRDPAREGLSLYPYVNNETLSFVDPTGMFMDPGAMYICDRVGDALACVQKWRDWWLRNHPWDKKHPPKYGPHMDKVGHCFVTCKAIKDCGLRRGAALAIGQGKEWIIDVIGKGGKDADDQAANELGADIAEKAGSNCLPDCIKAVQKKYGGIPRKYLGM